MTFDFNNLEDMLRDGITADSIAQAFTKNLNMAIEAANEGPTPFQEACSRLAEAWHDVLDTYADEADIDIDEAWYVNPETLEEGIPTVVKVLAATTDYMNAFNDVLPKNKDDVKKCEPTADMDFDDIVNSFLKDYNLTK